MKKELKEYLSNLEFNMNQVPNEVKKIIINSNEDYLLQIRIFNDQNKMLVKKAIESENESSVIKLVEPIKDGTNYNQIKLSFNVSNKNELDVFYKRYEDFDKFIYDNLAEIHLNDSNERNTLSNTGTTVNEIINPASSYRAPQRGELIEKCKIIAIELKLIKNETLKSGEAEKVQKILKERFSIETSLESIKATLRKLDYCKIQR